MEYVCNAAPIAPPASCASCCETNVAQLRDGLLAEMKLEIDTRSRAIEEGVRAFWVTRLGLLGSALFGSAGIALFRFLFRFVGLRTKIVAEGISKSAARQSAYVVFVQTAFQLWRLAQDVAPTPEPSSDAAVPLSLRQADAIAKDKNATAHINSAKALTEGAIHHADAMLADEPKKAEFVLTAKQSRAYYLAITAYPSERDEALKLSREALILVDQVPSPSTRDLRYGECVDTFIFVRCRYCVEPDETRGAYRALKEKAESSVAPVIHETVTEWHGLL
jgi:hypothetical protein